jgi:long-chain acyl-CoA synthetase
MPDRTVFTSLKKPPSWCRNAPASPAFTKDGKRQLRIELGRVPRRRRDRRGPAHAGIRKGDVVALDSERAWNFTWPTWASWPTASPPLYPTYPPKELVCTIQACDAKAVFAEDPQTLERLKEAPVAQWILLTGEAPGAITLDQLRQRGREAIARDPGLLNALRAEVQPSDNAILYLTSGATGEPKMVMVSHRALVANIDMGPNVLPTGPNDRTVAFLPSAHIAQRVVVELLPIRSGMPVTFAESLMKLPQEIKAVRPTIFLAPPRLWERIYATICTELKKRPAVAQKLFYTGLALGLAAARHRRQNEPVPARMRIPLAVIDRLAFSKVRAFRRPDACRCLRSRAARRRAGRILRSRRYAVDRRLRVDRRRRGRVQSHRAPETRQHREAAARSRGADRRRWRAAGEKSLSVLGLLQR